MRLLLDENLPVGLVADFPHWTNPSTVSEMGWVGLSDKELLLRASAFGFDHLVTIDKNLRHQQNLASFNIKVLILMAPNNRLQTLRSIAVNAVEALKIGLSQPWIEIAP